MMKTATQLPSRSSLGTLARRGLLAGLLAGSLGALAFGSVAGAQNIVDFNSNAPVSFSADDGELQDREGRALLWGNVAIQQGDLRLTADRVTIAYSSAGSLNIERINAVGNVVVTRGRERASGNAAVYDFARRLIVMSGAVSVNRGSDRLDAGRLTIDLNSGVSSVDGAGSRDRNGRISGTFTVPQGD